MLTRLKVSGFKNLVDVDVRFGPFTCIVGANGTGKSNLFDAIRFLSALADHTFVEAAQLVRDENGRSSDIRDLFHRVGEHSVDEMSFVAEMIVPAEGQDDLGQTARATITFLQYTLRLRHRENREFDSRGPIELVEEELVHINKSEANQYLLFAYGAKAWRESIIHGRRNNNAAFISTKLDVVYQHQDGGSRGKAIGRSIASLPRTLVSISNASETPTALLARREMQSWRLLQLEPAALRLSNNFNDPRQMAADGAYLASTLYRLAYTSDHPERVFVQVSNRLAELLRDVQEVWVERDEKRELFTLYLRQSDGTSHPARALSDGTLRFLALAVLELDPEATGLICLEEPENGVDPRRIPNMLNLLMDIATDTSAPVDDDNPLRQVIINTHSPVVVQQVPDDSVLVAELRERVEDGVRYKTAQFSPLPQDEQSNRRPWRLREDVPVVPKGRMLSYLNPVEPGVPDNGDTNGSSRHRVIDRQDMQQLLQLALPLEGEE